MNGTAEKDDLLFQKALAETRELRVHTGRGKLMFKVSVYRCDTLGDVRNMVKKGRESGPYGNEFEYWPSPLTFVFVLNNDIEFEREREERTLVWDVMDKYDVFVRERKGVIEDMVEWGDGEEDDHEEGGTTSCSVRRQTTTTGEDEKKGNDGAPVGECLVEVGCAKKDDGRKGDHVVEKKNKEEERQVQDEGPSRKKKRRIELTSTESFV